MLLAIDIGNTNINLGVFQGETLKATWRLATDGRRMPDEYALTLLNLLPMRGVSLSDVSDVAICSVVPPLTQVFTELCESYLRPKPLVVGAGVRTGIKVLYESPRDVGADRIVNAAAGYRSYGGPLIIVDFGTPTVFDAITANAEYLGGAIAPGPRVAAESLFTNTSQLRRVELAAPPSAIARNTVHAIQSGVFLGHVDMVEGMVRRFKRELGQESKVLATGSIAQAIAKETTVFDAISMDLTLIGLRLIYEMNLEHRQAKVSAD